VGTAVVERKKRERAKGISEMDQASETPRLRLLLVDDEPDLLSTLGDILQSQGYAVVSTWEGEEACEIAALYQPHIVVTDFRLPGMDGVATIHKLREKSPRLRAILVSGYITPVTRERARREAVDQVLEKPVSVPDLLRALDKKTG
jgi:CheY-like chemotaxis protein